jgi:hypothetical protein
MYRRLIRVALVALIALSLGLSVAGLRPALAQTAVTGCGFDEELALSWMLTLQNDDGGFSNGFTPGSDLGATADAVLALIALGEDADAPLAYLAAQVADGAAATAGQIGKVLLAVAAAEGNATNFGGVNLIAQARAALEGEPDASGYFGAALAMLGMARAGAMGEIPPAAFIRLFEAQDEGGGWAFAPDQAPDTNTTAIAILVATATGNASRAIPALDYLRAIQNEDGGWPYQSPSEWGTDSDANSTALVLQALVSARQDLSEWNNPQELLATFQLEDGSFTYQLAMPGPSFLAAVAAVPALCEAAAWVIACELCPIFYPTPTRTSP